MSDAVAGSMNDEWPSGLDTGEFQPAIQTIQINIPEVQALGKQTVWIKTLAVVLGIGISAAVGYGIRDYQLIKNTRTYLDVKVLEKYSDIKYLLQPARMQPWISNPCSPIDLTPGSTMKFYTYEQMHIPDCHRVKAFEFYANSKGERVDASAIDEIQMR